VAKQEVPFSRQKEKLLTLVAPLFINLRLSKRGLAEAVNIPEADLYHING
jgi:hypothetical protein